MILSIPHQAFEIEKIHLMPFVYDKYGKSIARLSYKDNSIDFQDVSILSPAMKVIDYNPENSRLRVDLGEQPVFQTKLNALQEYLTSTFYIHQQSFLGQSNNLHSDIRDLFHYLLIDSTLSLYIFPTSIIKRENGTISKVSELRPGDTIRCVIRFQGVSQIQNKYGMRLRLQHSVPALWFVTN